MVDEKTYPKQKLTHENESTNKRSASCHGDAKADSVTASPSLRALGEVRQGGSWLPSESVLVRRPLQNPLTLLQAFIMYWLFIFVISVNPERIPRRGRGDDWVSKAPALQA